MSGSPSGGAQPLTPRVAIAHDYLTQRGGAERVVLALSRAFPEATIYTTLYDPEGTYPEFRNARIVTSPLNRFAFLRRHHRFALPLLPFIAGALRTDADVVIASSSGWAHGFRHPSGSPVLVYCHNPARWLYQTEDYLGHRPTRSLTGWALLVLRPFLLRWDRTAAARAHRYFANAWIVRERIVEAYGIDAWVVPPPHGMDASLPQEPVEVLRDWVSGEGSADRAGSSAAGPDGYHLLVSRLLPYKNVHHAVEAFRGLPERLVVVGSGPLEPLLRRELPGNVRLVSQLSDAQLRWVYAHATALVAPSFEDFGLTPLEAGAFGKPTLALRAGGYLETIVPGATGTFFEHATPEAIRDAVVANRDARWDADAIRAHAEEFAEPRFHERLREEVREAYEAGRA